MSKVPKCYEWIKEGIYVIYKGKFCKVVGPNPPKKQRNVWKVALLDADNVVVVNVKRIRWPTKAEAVLYGKI